jgi:hypothetical protein
MYSNAMRSLCFTLLFTGTGGAQTAPPSAPSPQTTSIGTGAYSWWAGVGLTCGAGASEAAAAVKPTAQCGALMYMPFFALEAGVMGPQAKQSNVFGYLSTNFWIPLVAPSKVGNANGVPLFVGGYTRMFETGHALDYGVAFAKPIDVAHSVQFEVRDYWEFSNAQQHNVVFRVVWLVGLPD